MYLIDVRAILDIEEKKVPRSKVLKLFYDTDLDGIQYAMLSHCWCAVEEDKSLFNEIRDLSIEAVEKLQGHGGYQMVIGGCNKARADGIDWLWAAPCCIPWENETDLHDVNAYSSSENKPQQLEVVPVQLDTPGINSSQRHRIR